MKKLKFSNIIIIFSILITFVFLGYNVINANKESISILINSLLITIMAIILIFPTKNKKTNKQAILAILIISITSFNAYTYSKPVKEITFVANLYNKTLSEAIKWSEENKIELVQKFDYSDYIEKYHIISQNIINEPLENITKLEVIISNGPNYESEVTLPNYTGSTLDELIEYINKNYLNNVQIQFIEDTNEPNTIIEQSQTGLIKRNTKVTFKIASAPFQEIEMIDLKNKTLFEVKLWLEKNKITYELIYEFDLSDKNNCLKQSIEPNTIVKEDDVIKITISKGPSITIPSFNNMNKNEITEWIIKNNLKITYKEEYNKDIELGKIISVNYNENDIVEQGTEIIITISKGPLKMIKYTTLSEFKNWANENEIKYNVDYEFNNSISKGNLIKSSHQENDIIAENESINLTLSQGSPVTVPNFKGMTKANIITKCNNLNLNCSFTNYGYTTSINEGIAVTQSVAAARQVVSGSYITISLSKGIAKTFTIEINETDLVLNNAASTITRLKSIFASKYPGVTFKFVTLSSNIYRNAGFIHENSIIKNGTKVTQGKAYTITITS